jgi:hypothetical protein
MSYGLKRLSKGKPFKAPINILFQGVNMKVAGLCHICGKPAMTSCPMCGRMVCGSHMDRASGVCFSCKGQSPDNIGRKF